MALAISLLPGTMPVVDTTDSTKISSISVLFTADVQASLPSNSDAILAGNYYVYNDSDLATRINVDTATALTPTPALPSNQSAYQLNFAAGTGPTATNVFSIYFKNSTTISNELFIDNTYNIVAGTAGNIPVTFNTPKTYTINTSAIDGNNFAVTTPATVTVYAGPNAGSSTLTAPAGNLIMWQSSITVPLTLTVVSNPGDNPFPTDDYSLVLTSSPADEASASN